MFPYEKTGWKHLYAVSANGGTVQQLTKGAFEVHSTALSKARQTLYYLANAEEDLARLGLYHLNVEQGLTPKRLAIGDPDEMAMSLAAMPGGGGAYELA